MPKQIEVRINKKILSKSSAAACYWGRLKSETFTKNGSSVKVMFELELAGSEDILTQLLKLSEDTLIVPAQFVSDVLVVT